MLTEINQETHFAGHHPYYVLQSSKAGPVWRRHQRRADGTDVPMAWLGGCLVTPRSLHSLFCGTQHLPCKEGIAETLNGPSSIEVSKLKGCSFFRQSFESSGLGIKVEGEVVSLTLKLHNPEIKAAEAVLWIFSPIQLPVGASQTGGCTQSPPSSRGGLSLIHRG